MPRAMAEIEHQIPAQVIAYRWCRKNKVIVVF